LFPYVCCWLGSASCCDLSVIDSVLFMKDPSQTELCHCPDSDQNYFHKLTIRSALGCNMLCWTEGVSAKLFVLHP
jgi:hypothetical protein